MAAYIWGGGGLDLDRRIWVLLWIILILRGNMGGLGGVCYFYSYLFVVVFIYS